jgi:phospholipid-binding lipoprotein MlaA
VNAPQRLAAAARATFVIVALVGLSGCATLSGNATPGQVADPWENWNRKVYAFNEAVDGAVLKPVAETYRDVLPAPVRTGIGNVLGNIGDVWSTANHFLQGKLQSGFEMGMRVLTNTLFGLGGLLDPATEFGLERRSEDFGQTLGHWGLGNGPFVVLPLLGPSTLRDTAGLLVDRQAAPGSLPSKEGERYALTALELVNARADLLSTTQLLDRVALDKYVFIRDGFLSRRRDQLFDGAPPMETFDDGGDEPPPAAPAKPTLAPATPAASAAAPAASAPAAPRR